MWPTPKPRSPATALVLLGCAVAALLSASVRAEPPESADWAVRNWQSDDGLPSNQVIGCTQSADGYLWIATYAALARFDGARFDEYRPRSLGLASNQKFSAIARAGAGALWLGTVRGSLLRIDPQGPRSFDAVAYKPVQIIVTDGHGTVWLEQQGGFVSRWRGYACERLGSETGLPGPDTSTRYGCSLAVDRSGTLWFAKNGRVGVFERDRFVTRVVLDNGPLRIGRARQGGVWLCAGVQVLHVTEEGALQRRATLPGRDTTEPTAVHEDRAGRLWIGTRNDGLYCVDENGVQSVPTTDVRVTDIAEDDQGDLWVSTEGGGLNRLRPRIIRLEQMSGMPLCVIQSLAEDDTGRIWAAAQNGALLRSGPEGWQVLSDLPSWPGGRAAAVARGHDGAIWIGTRDHALHRWRAGAYTSWRAVNGLAGREIHALLVSRAGDVWMGLSAPECVQRLHQGKLELQTIPENPRVIRAVAEDAAGDIWFGTSRGLLLRFHDGVMNDETGATAGEPLSIRCLAPGPEGSLWIGYADEGIGWWRRGEYHRTGADAGFPEESVSQLARDPAGRIWIAGDHGVFHVDESALEAYVRGRGAVPHFLHHGPSEGLFSVEANSANAPGTLMARDGRLWIPLRTALAVVDPRRVTDDPTPPRLLITRVERDDATLATYHGLLPSAPGQPVPTAGRRLALPADHDRLAIEFTSPDFAAPENIRHRYRLTGYERGWVQAGGARRATYSRLPAGDYQFEVQAGNSDGTWNPAGARLALHVAPFWWATWWFRSLALAGFTTAVIVVVRRAAVRRMAGRLRELEQQAAVTRERTRIARDLHDEFGTRLTELGLRVALDDTPAPAAGERTELLESIRHLERDLDTIVWSINPRNDTLDRLVSFLCRDTAEFLGPAGLRCRLEVPEDVPPIRVGPEFRHHVSRAVREAVNNVVRHAAATTVRMAFALEDDALTIRVENDGPGFSLAAAEASGRSGLANMRARMEELGGCFTVTTSADGGTTITFRVPVCAVAVEAPPA